MTSTGELSGRGVLLVGASSDIGLAIAQRFLSRGDRVVGVSREDIPVEFPHHVADCADPAAVAGVVGTALPELGDRLDVVVTAAAVDARHRVVDTDDDAWRSPVAATLDTVFYTCRESLPYMTRGGCIVAVSSVVANIASPGIAGYAAAKGGVNSLIRVLALECGAEGIRVNAVAPGLIGGSALTNAAAGYPLGRTGTPDDVAGAVAFLASDDAAFITGTVLTVDGGLSAGQPGAYLRPDLQALLKP